MPLLRAALLAAALSPAVAAPTAPPQELHHRLDVSDPAHAHDLALTLDACGGAVDRRVIDTLVRLHVPATIFATRRWIDRNPDAVQALLAHPDLFEIENHGAAHVPAVVGRRLYNMKGPGDLAGVEREIADGAAAVARASGRPPHWYRGAGAAYDDASRALVERLGYRIAGFSLNADAGATLAATAVARRLRQAAPGDIVIAHMNRPASGTGAALAEVLPELRSRGFGFVRLSQAAGVLPQRAKMPAP